MNHAVLPGPSRAPGLCLPLWSGPSNTPTEISVSCVFNLTRITEGGADGLRLTDSERRLKLSFARTKYRRVWLEHALGRL